MLEAAKRIIEAGLTRELKVLLELSRTKVRRQSGNHLAFLLSLVLNLFRKLVDKKQNLSLTLLHLNKWMRQVLFHSINHLLLCLFELIKLGQLVRIPLETLLKLNLLLRTLKYFLQHSKVLLQLSCSFFSRTAHNFQLIDDFVPEGLLLVLRVKITHTFSYSLFKVILESELP